MSERTKCNAFYAVQGTDPLISCLGEPKKERDQQHVNPDDVLATMQQINDCLRVEMRRSQAVQEQGAYHGSILTPHIQEGSNIWLDAYFIQTMRPIQKIACMHLGDSMVVRRISPSEYVPELAASIQIHPVQPLSLFDPVVSDPFTGDLENPPPLVEVDCDVEQQVSSVENSRIYRNLLQYSIHWTGYDSVTCEPAKFEDG